jgi:hypothetical protein
MKVEDFIVASVQRVKEAGLRPAVIHFDLHVHWDLETGQGTVVYGVVKAGEMEVAAPALPPSKLSAVRLCFSVPVRDGSA